MADSEITVTAAQFAQKIKEEYSQYASVADDGLLDMVEGFIQKNPQYHARYAERDGGTTLVSFSWDSPELAPAPNADQAAGIAPAVAAIPSVVQISTEEAVHALAAQESTESNTESNSKAGSDSGTTVGRRYAARNKTALGKRRHAARRNALSEIKIDTPPNQQDFPKSSDKKTHFTRYVLVLIVLLVTVFCFLLIIGSIDLSDQKGIDSRAQEIYQQGITLQAAGKLSEAKAAFEKVVQQLPTSTSATGAQQKLTEVNDAIAKAKPGIGFRGLHGKQSRAEVESVLKAQSSVLKCKAPENDGSLNCEASFPSGEVMKSIHFSPDNRLTKFYFEGYYFGSTITSQVIYHELVSALGPGTPSKPSGIALVEALERFGKAQNFEWNAGEAVPCELNREVDCPAQQITLNLGPTIAIVQFWDWEYIATSQGITKLDPNMPKPKVAQTFVLMGLRGGDSQSVVEDALRDRGYAMPLDCEYNSEELTNKCSTSQGNYRLSVTFLHEQLSSFDVTFPKSEWKEKVRRLLESFGEPTDRDARKTSEVIKWESQQTVTCLITNTNEQCPSESVILVISDQNQDAQEGYNYLPLIKQQIHESAERMVDQYSQ